MSFSDLFRDSEVQKTIISIIIARESNFLTNSLLNDIILPLINRDGNNDGVDDIAVLKKYKLNLFGAELRIGRFLITIIKHIIIISVVYLVYKFTSKAPKEIDEEDATT